MNKFKSLVLGSAAGIMAVAGAQAADMPVAPPPGIDCPVGFINMPGTDICLRVGGFARMIIGVQDDESTFFGDGVGSGVGASPNGEDEFIMHAQARLNFDARRQTDHGTVRAFVEGHLEDSNGNTGGPFKLRHAFAQIGNWVFGKTWSTFLHGASDPNGSWYSPVAHSIRIVQVRYTHQIGNGVTFSVALEDHAYENNAGFAGNGGANDNDVPNIVAALNYSAGPMDAQISAAVKFNEYLDGTDSTGFAVLGGLAWEITESVSFVGKAIYTDEASSYSFDWIGRANFSRDEEILALMAALAFNIAPGWSAQVAGGWGTVDDNDSVVMTANSARDIFAVSGLVQWRPASGFDILAEVVYTDTDWDDPTITDTDGIMGTLSFRASLN